jgi:hypothetical protein
VAPQVGVAVGVPPYAEPMTGWQQLWFGYAVSGPEGQDREQVLACTPGVLEDPVVERQLRRLCRYDADDSPAARRLGAPQSFGWVDDDELRFVFCRTPVLSSDRSATTVAAHILVGPRSAASALDILALFDSPTWWRGESLDASLRDSGGQLPEIAFEEFEATVREWQALQPRVTEDVLADLAEAVLSSAGTAPVVLPHLPRQAVATMVALARQVPALVDLVGFSSHELGPPQQWFDIVACASADARPEAPTVERVLARHGGPVLGAARLGDAQAMVSAVLPFVVARHGELDRSRRDLFFRAIDALVRRNQDGIAWLVNDPRSLLLLVSSSTGREVAAESLWGRIRPRWIQGNQALERWSDELRELGALTWRRRPPGVTQDAITDVWSELGALGHDAQDGFVRAFMDEALTGKRADVDPPGRLVAAALRSALDSRLAPDSTQRLVDLAAEHMDPDLLTSQVVPVGWRVRLAVTALQTGTLTREVLAAASARDRQLAQHLLGEDIDDDAVGAILGAVPPEEAAALLAAGIHTLGTARALRSLREVGRALGSARALSVLEALRSVVGLPLGPEDQEWVAGHFARAASAGAHDSRRPDPVTDLPWDLAKTLSSGTTAVWRRTAYLVRPRGDETRQSLLDQFELLLAQVADERERHAIATVGVATCLLTAYTADHVDEIIDVLGAGQGLDSSEQTSLLLTCAERMATAPRRTGIGAILVHIGRTSVRRRGLKRRAVLRDEHQVRAEALAARMTQHQWREVLRAAAGQDARCVQWVRGLKATSD